MPIKPPVKVGATQFVPEPLKQQTTQGLMPVPATPPVNRGAGWYFQNFPPDAVEYFHITVLNQTLGTAGDPIAASETYNIVGNAPVFGSPTGQVYLTTDFMFHVWRVDGGGALVSVSRNDVAFNFLFNFLIDGIPIRYDVR